MASKGDRQTNRDQKCAQQTKPPALEEFRIVPPSKTETGEQPNSGQERHGDKPPILPISYFVRPHRIASQSSENTFDSEHRHPGYERPMSDGAPLIPRYRQS